MRATFANRLLLLRATDGAKGPGDAARAPDKSGLYRARGSVVMFEALRLAVVVGCAAAGTGAIAGCRTRDHSTRGGRAERAAAGGPNVQRRAAMPTEWPVEATPLDRSAARLEIDTQEHLAWAEAFRRRIVEAGEPWTIANTLIPYNELRMHLDAARSECELFARVHPGADVRAAAEQGEQEVLKYATELSLDPGLYEAFRTLDVSGADEATQFVVFKILRDFRRAGVDRDAETRERIAELNDEIVKLGQAFARNTREDVREILLDSAAELDGLPEDWKAKHRPGEDGRIRVTTQYPDYYPVMTYARVPFVRERLYREFKNRGHPANIAVLSDLIARRYELARLLGYPHWAAYATEDKMIGSAVSAASFIERIASISREPARRDYAVLLARKREDFPEAQTVEDWEKDYYENRIKTERYAFDPQSVRPYFEFRQVQEGLFDLTSRLFGVTYRRVDGLSLWHEDVTAWDVFEGEQRLGRFYLDLHPRPDKYGHAAQFDYRTGVSGRRLPQAVLVCNFPNPNDSPGGVALMEHSEVETFFHEFGHLLHTIFAGHRRWMGNGGISTEWDFVEAPSQMLEEWCYDTAALQLFARHFGTGEPIPGAHVDRLRAAAEFGKGPYVAHQMFYAAVSLNYYNRDPLNLDTNSLMIDLQREFSPFPYMPDTHFQCSFGHLDGYSAYYYTYMWSLVIAKDLFSRFASEGMLNAETAMHYRRSVLDPGGSKRAAELVADFLGRPFAFDAFEAWLNRN